METIELLAKSSSSPEEPYTVTFTKDDSGSVTVRCTCRAGIFGQLCKHKFKFAQGNDSMLYDDEDDAQFTALDTASEWIKNSSAFDIMRQLWRLEKESNEIKAKIKQTKKAIGQGFKEGFK